MRRSRHVLSFCAASAMLAGCGGSQPPIGGPGLTPQGGTAPDLGVNRTSARTSTKSCPAAACIYVSNGAADGSITVYAANATGNVRPYRTIAGAKTGLTNPFGVAVDSRGKVYVIKARVLVFSATAHGDVYPLRSITTRSQQLSGIALDANRNVYASNIKIIGQCRSGCRLKGYVTEYAAGSRGNVPPIRTIRGRKTRLFNVGGISVDSIGNVYVATTPSCRTSSQCRGKTAILVYGPGAHRDAAPSWMLSGSQTRLIHPNGVAVDDAGNVYVSDVGSVYGSVYVYASGQHGNVAPIQAISGPKTNLVTPLSVAVDTVHHIYVANSQAAGSVTVYAAGATGNVAPIQTINGPRTGLVIPSGIAVH
jgi:hypothetical protein